MMTIRSTRMATLAAIALLSVACGDSATTPNDPGPTVYRLAVEAGDDQHGTVGMALPEAVRVRLAAEVEEVHHRSLLRFADSSMALNFVVTKGGGSLFVQTVILADVDSAINYWTMGPTAGEQAFEVRAVNQTTGEQLTFATVTATADPGPFARGGFAAHDVSSFGLAPVALGAFAEDSFGNALVPEIRSGDSVISEPWHPTALGVSLLTSGGDTLRVRSHAGRSLTATVYSGGHSYAVTARLTSRPALAGECADTALTGGIRLGVAGDSLVVVRDGSDTLLVRPGDVWGGWMGQTFGSRTQIGCSLAEQDQFGNVDRDYSVTLRLPIGAMQFQYVQFTQFNMDGAALVSELRNSSDSTEVVARGTFAE